MAAPGVGDPAPDFSLAGTGGRTYSLSEFRGRPVVLVFYPGDASPVCSAQLDSYAEGIDSFVDAGADVIALSPQGLESKEKWEGERGTFPFPLLADADSEVGRAYGVVGPLGFYRRSIFVVNGDGIICYAHRAMAGLTYRPVSELVEAIHACEPPAR